MGAKRAGGALVATASRMTMPEAASADEVNLEALSDEEIEGLLGDDAGTNGPADPKDGMR